ncbi:MAG: hypothetical protein WC624_00320 [Candidatus Margulisiibacteriota bacterium]
MRSSFPAYQQKLSTFEAAISKAEDLGHSGTINKTMAVQLKKMATISLRMLRDVRETIRINPALKLKGDDLRMFAAVNMKARGLLDRLSRLPEKLDAFTESADSFDLIEDLAGPSAWDPDPSFRRGKKIYQ